MAPLRLIFSVICEAIGLGVIVAIIVPAFFGLFTVIKEGIHKIRVHYKAKHRFDKPPMAKCYCVDCCSYIESAEICVLNGCGYASDHFCAYAKPKV